jgi:hypothetical protein
MSATNFKNRLAKLIVLMGMNSALPQIAHNDVAVLPLSSTTVATPRSRESRVYSNTEIRGTATLIPAQEVESLKAGGIKATSHVIFCVDLSGTLGEIKP